MGGEDVALFSPIEFHAEGVERVIFPLFLVEIRRESGHKYFLFMFFVGVAPAIEQLMMFVEVVYRHIHVELEVDGADASEFHICFSDAVFKIKRMIVEHKTIMRVMEGV